MTIEQFIEADEMEQIEAIWDGRLIAETKDKDYNYKLYEIDSFYVETKQDIEKARVNLIFDLSVPSNVATDVAEIEGVTLYNIDTLSEIVNNTIEQRRNELPLAENIIEEHFEEFKEWEEKRAFYRMKEAEQKDIQNEIINKIGNYENHTNCNQNKPACSLADQCCKE